MSANPRVRRRQRLGDLLVAAGAISEADLQTALAEQKRTRRRLGETLKSQGLIDDEGLLSAISRQLAISRIDFRAQPVDAQKARKLPELVARRLRAVLITEQVDGYLVAMSDPTDLMAEDELERTLGRPVSVAVASERDILEVLDRIYVGNEKIEKLAAELGQELGTTDVEQGLDTSSSDALVSRLINSLLEEALRVGASDVHIEPGEAELHIRFRVDGVLQEQPVARKNVAASMVSRLKLSAGLNIAERRLPQDGRFRVTIRGTTLDIRIATLPTQHGEAVVMRLLNQAAGNLDLSRLGMPAELQQRLRRIIHQPYGMLLVTGPTGSGKSTTLYAALTELNQPERKIITIEDPVEYRLPLINQVQIQPQIGLDFARVLRTTLRHDPDVVLIGEMRDQETAEIGLRAAITGHMVMSTLHTNDAPATAVRLLDMGAPGFLVASALQAIVAQRLVRCLCEHCHAPCTPDVHERVWLESLGDALSADAGFHGPVGCDRCHGTGYSGRVGIYELLEIDEEMSHALRSNDAAAFARAAVKADGYRPLAASALALAIEGRTSLAEVRRVTGSTLGGL